MKTMERTAVRSQEIAIVGYDEETRTLEIVFRRGGVYHYFDVPQGTYHTLMAAPSRGTYFSQAVKNRFRYAKVR